MSGSIPRRSTPAGHRTKPPGDGVGIGVRNGVGDGVRDGVGDGMGDEVRIR